MSSSYRDTLNAWLSKLEVSADSVLDIGGSQEKVSKRVKSWNVIDYKIADLPTPHVGSPLPDIEVDMNRKASFDQEYDVVFCLEVFEYIWDPATAFRNLATATKFGGTIYATFMSQYPLHQPVEDDALRYMPAGIKKLAQHSNLVVADMIPRRFETDAFYKFFSAERMRAAKNEDLNFSGWIVEFRK